MQSKKEENILVCVQVNIKMFLNGLSFTKLFNPILRVTRHFQVNVNTFRV